MSNVEKQRHNQKQEHPKKQKTPREKPKYNMWQTSSYMISLAIQDREKKILVLGLLLTLLSLAISLTELFITPVILGFVERRAPLSALLTAILTFLLLSILFNGMRTYLDANWSYGKITLRLTLISLLNNKASTTSYPNLLDGKFQKMLRKGFDSLNSNSAAGEAVWDTLFCLFKDLLGFVIYFALLTAVNPALFIIIILITLAGYFINKPLSKYEYWHRKEIGAIDKGIFAMRDYADGAWLAKDIRLFGMEPWLKEVHSKFMNARKAFKRRAQNVYLWGNAADLILAFLRNGVIYAYLIRQALEGGLSASLFLLYFSAAGIFSSWITRILNDFLTLHSQSLELSNIIECINYPEPFVFDQGESLVPDSSMKYELRLENVSFRYPETENDILSHVNLTLTPGEKLAIVGLNGAGKTTLIKLLCGFYDPDEGRVLLNGRDIREYNRRDYYRMFSAVFQNFTLLPASVAVNVAQTDGDIRRENVTECLEKAGLLDKVNSLPQQQDTLLNREIYEDASALSGGETQRLMLARALYKDAPFVVLDEPTAALDPLAEADLYGKYHEMTQGHSSVYISHRLASTRFCDRIILIENGELAEEGTHESLLAKNGKYAKLFEVQSKYYKEGVENREKES